MFSIIKRHRILFLSAQIVLGCLIFLVIGSISPSKVAATNHDYDSCYTPTGYVNVQIGVLVMNPDGTGRGYSTDFSIRAAAFNPYPNSPDNWSFIEPGTGRDKLNDSIIVPGQGSFRSRDFTPNSDCPAYGGGRLRAVVFSDGQAPRPDRPLLDCLQGAWSGPSRPHSAGFAFQGLSVNDVGGAAGYWSTGLAFHGPGINGVGKYEDLNNRSFGTVLVYQLTSWPGNNSEGWLDAASCNTISGWARDMDYPNNPIEVHLYFDGPPGTGVGWNLGPASGYRSDVGNHAYVVNTASAPINIYDGNPHVVRAYGINIGPGSNVELLGSPKTFGPCAPPLVSPTVTITPIVTPEDTENPLNVDYKATVSTTHLMNGVTITCSYYIKPISGSPNVSLRPDDTGTMTPTTSYVCEHDDVPIAPNILSAGDGICIKVVVTPGSGTYKSDGTLVTPGPATVRELCPPVSNKPYVSFYGNDIKAGGNHAGATCVTQPAKGVRTYSKNNAGSGVQFAAFALGSIQDFSTAMGSSLSPKKLAFSNTLASPGSFGSYGTECTHDYQLENNATAAWTGFVGTEGKRRATGSNVTLGATTLARGQHIYLYASGDVTITGNIDYESTGWVNKNDIPSLYVVARGNIYIDKGVSRVYGVYVAQETGKGIYTCTNDSTPYTATTAGFYADCGTQLVINGSFVSKNVKLLRTFGSIRNAVTGDNPLGSAKRSNCSSASGALSSVQSCAAEVFMFNSSIYIANSPEAINTVTSSASDYDYITNLPPVL